MATLTKSTGTVTLTGAAEKVNLPAVYGWVWIKNMSESDIFAGLSADISEGADGVMTIPAGECGRVQADGFRSVYLLGTGNALIVAQNYADCPFKVSKKGGESGGGIYPIDEDGYPCGDVIIPEGVTSISSESDNTKRKSCFFANNNITTVKIPSSMQTLGYHAFSRSSLTDVILGANSNIAEIGSYCFYSCAKLKSIFIPKKVSIIGGYAFYGCSELTYVTFEEGSLITEIPTHCFDNCKSLTSIEIPAGVTVLGSSAFYNCSNIASVTLPNTITSINTASSSNNTFGGCTALKTVDLEMDFNCDISLYKSTALTNAAEMLTKLKDLTGDTAKTITFAKVVYDSLTADEIAVATNKNWTVASYGS